MLKNCKILAKINITNSLLKRNDIKSFFSQSKKHMNTLILSEEQYSNNLIC